MLEFKSVCIAGLSMLEVVRKRIIEENLKTQGEILSYLDKFINQMTHIVNDGDTEAELLFNLLKS